jgi:hypothetical protein
VEDCQACVRLGYISGEGLSPHKMLSPIKIFSRLKYCLTEIYNNCLLWAKNGLIFKCRLNNCQ